MKEERWGRSPVWVTCGALLFASCLGAMKLAMLRNCQYTSDLFVYDQMLEHTLRGHFGLEYTFGNLFGEHAYPVILTLVLLKAIFGRWMPVLLVILSPAIYVAAIVSWFVALSRRVSLMPALLATFCLALPLRGGSALLEQIYGFHLDFSSGYLAASFASIMWSGSTSDGGELSGRDRLRFFFLLSIFILVKEDTAILAVAFLAILLLGSYSRLILFSLVAALGVLFADAVVMGMSVTEWNRGDARLFRQVLNMIADGQLISLLHDSNFLTWATVGGGSVVLLLVAIRFTGKGDRVAIALFTIGLLKLGSSLLVNDFDLTTWHNAPAICMLTGGLILQVVSGGATREVTLVLGAAAIASGLAFVVCDLPLLLELKAATRARASYVAESRRDLAQLRLLVPPRSVVAIEGLTSVEWSDGHRFSFFPRGVTESPRGIADYVVLERPGVREFSSQLKEFRPVASSSWFVLFERRSISKAHAAERERFRKRFGDDAIGVWPDRSVDP